METVHNYLRELHSAYSHAWLNYQVWWIYKNDRAEFEKVMNKYLMFFTTSIHAHFVAMLVALYRLYETRTDTFNVPSIIKLLEENEGNLQEINNLYLQAKPIWIKVGIIRNKAFGHRDIEYTIVGAFKEAGLGYDELKNLIDFTREILIKISSLTKYNLTFDFNSDKDTLKMLQALQS
jgi:hypothetical protein